MKRASRHRSGLTNLGRQCSENDAHGLPRHQGSLPIGTFKDWLSRTESNGQPPNIRSGALTLSYGRTKWSGLSELNGLFRLYRPTCRRCHFHPKSPTTFMCFASNHSPP